MRNRISHMRPPGLAAFALVLAASACSHSSAHPSVAPTPSTTGSAVWNIVALGDSDTTGSGDPTGIGWVGRYARLLQQKLGLNVDVINLAVDGTTSDQLLSEMRSDLTMRQEVAHAKIVLIGIGGADLNTGDADLQAGTCQGLACYVPVLQQFGRNFEAIVAQVGVLRSGAPTVIRAITLPNGLPGAESVVPPFVTPRISLYESAMEKRFICRSMAKHGGQCIDDLRAFNGPSGMQDAFKSGLMNLQDCCYPSAKGQQLMAKLLFDTGLAPLQP